MSQTKPFFIPQKEFDLLNQMNEELIDEIVGQSVDIYKVNVEQTDSNLYGESTTKFYDIGFRVNCLIEYAAPEINSMGRNWIRKYTLALAKELLGIIRSKYAALPLPNGEVSMDGEALKSEGREEKANLLEELNTFLEAVSKKEQAATEQEVANSQQEVLNKAPLKIYIG